MGPILEKRDRASARSTSTTSLPGANAQPLVEAVQMSAIRCLGSAETSPAPGTPPSGPLGAVIGWIGPVLTPQKFSSCAMGG